MKVGKLQITTDSEVKCYIMIFSHLDVVVEGGEVERGVAVVLLLVHDPRPRQLRKQHPHRAAKKKVIAIRISSIHLNTTYSAFVIINVQRWVKKWQGGAETSRNLGTTF